MRLFKFSLFAIIVALSMSKGANGQYVQPMGYKDYSFWEHVNIGNRGAKTTNDAAYLELGKPTGSNKGFLLPRGNKDSIVSPTYGLVFYNNPDSAIYYFDGVAWKNLSRPEGAPGDGNNYASTLGFNTGTDALTIGRNGLSNLSTSIPLSIKLNKVDTTAKWLHKIARSHDSVFYYINGVPTFAFKDSVGTGGGGGTATVKAFPTINALKVSTFHTTPGDLKADILDGGRSFKWNGESTASDDGGVTTVVPTTGTGAWERIFRGVVRADEVGIKNDGTNQTTAINSLLSMATVKEVLFDNGDVTINGAVNFQNKKITFQNNARLVGTGAIQNALIVADNQQQIFSTTLNTDNALINGEVSVAWWGATPDFVMASPYSQSKTDNLTAFNKALASVKNKDTYVSYKTSAKIYIPPVSDVDHSYYLSNTWKVDRSIEIYGDLSSIAQLVFPHGVVGVWLKGPDAADTASKGGFGSYVHDITIVGNNSRSDWTFDDGVSFGVLLQQNKAELDRVTVYSFGSHGIYDSAAVPHSNANNCLIKYCSAYYNGGYGLAFLSTDANQCYVLQGDYSLNVRGGMSDRSFLGNSGVSVHAASNVTLSTFNKSCAHYGGHRWICKVDGTVGVTPGTDATVWQDMGLASADAAYTTYDAAKTYYYGGAYRFGDNNQNSIWNNLYSETDQWAGTAVGTTAMIIGNIGVLMDGYAMKKTAAGLTVEQITADEKTYGGWKPILSGAHRYIGWQDYTRASTLHGFKYYGDDNIWRVNSGNDDNTNATFFGSGFGAGNFGRSVTPSAGIAVGQLWFGKNRAATSNYRSLSLGDAVPTTGEFAVGDFVLNIGTDNTILGWKCATAGTFGGTSPTFDIITAGGSGGGSPSLTQYHVGVGNGSNVLGGSSDLTYNGTKLSINGNVELTGGTGGAARNINFGGGYGSPNLTFYDPGPTGRYGLGIGSSEMQLFVPDGGHVSFNSGGDQQTTGTNERARIDGSGMSIAALGTGGNRLVARNTSSYLYDTGIDPTNLALTSGSYANPSWITSLAASKLSGITGTPDGTKFLRDDYTWQTVSSGGGGVTTMAAIGSSPNGDGASISGSTLTLQPASSSFGGVVTTGAQTFEGTKTFNQNILSNGSGVFSGEIQSTYGSFGELGTAPTTPTGRGIFWAKSDGTPHYLNDAGVDVQLGGSSSSSSTIATLNVNTTDVSNSGTSETDLMSYTLPAGKLVNVGDRLVIEADFSTATNANNKTLIFYFGGYTHTQSPSTIASGTTIRMRFTVIKTGAGTQKITREFLTSFSTSPGNATASVTDTGTILIKFTGTSGTASSDITQNAMIITYYPAP